MNKELTEYLVKDMGAPFITGLVIGYALKKIIKFVILVVGLFLIAMIYAEHKGMITISTDALMQIANTPIEHAREAWNVVYDRVTKINTTEVSATVGLVAGFKIG